MPTRIRDSPPPISSGILRSLWTLAQPPAFTPRPPHAAALPFRLDRRRGIAPLADVYLPDTAGPHASVLIVHGGGFVVGSRHMKPVRYSATQRYASIVSFFGVYDFTYLGGIWPEAMRRLLLRSADPHVWAAHSPLAHCHTSAPLMLVHGGADTLVPIAQARTLHARRTELGLPVRLLEYPDAPHGFLNDATYPATRAAVDAAISFPYASAAEHP